MELEWQEREKDSRFPVHYLCLKYKGDIIAVLAQTWKYPEHDTWTIILGTALKRTGPISTCPELPEQPCEGKAKESIRAVLDIKPEALDCIAGHSIDLQ